jgi:hypothetical protein
MAKRHWYCERRNAAFQCEGYTRCLGRLTGSPVAQPVKHNCDNDDDTCDDFLDPVWKVHLRPTVRHNCLLNLPLFASQPVKVDDDDDKKAGDDTLPKRIHVQQVSAVVDRRQDEGAE